MNRFAEIFRRERKRRGFSQAEMGKMLGVSKQNIRAYERGTREPSFQSLLKVARCYGVSLDYLVTGEEFEENEPEGAGVTIKWSELKRMAGNLEADVAILKGMMSSFENQYMKE